MNKLAKFYNATIPFITHDGKDMPEILESFDGPIRLQFKNGRITDASHPTAYVWNREKLFAKCSNIEQEIVSIEQEIVSWKPLGYGESLTMYTAFKWQGKQ